MGRARVVLENKDALAKVLDAETSEPHAL